MSNAKSLGDIFDVTKNAIYRSVNALDASFEIIERTTLEANKANEIWAKKQQAQRQAELKQLASDLGMTEEEAKAFLAA
jgi:hypothetical protein